MRTRIWIVHQYETFQFTEGPSFTIFKHKIIYETVFGPFVFVKYASYLKDQINPIKVKSRRVQKPISENGGSEGSIYAEMWLELSDLYTVTYAAN